MMIGNIRSGANHGKFGGVSYAGSSSNGPYRICAFAESSIHAGVCALSGINHFGYADFCHRIRGSADCICSGYRYFANPYGAPGGEDWRKTCLNFWAFCKFYGILPDCMVCP